MAREHGRDRRRRRERDRLHPARDRAVRPRPGELEQVVDVVRSTRRTASSVSVASAITVFPWPDWKNSKDGFLSPPMFASRIARSGFTGARCIT